MEKSLLSKNLSYLLEQKIISSDKMLKITGHTSPGLISMWKNGERTIMTADLVKIANYLGYTVDQMINQDISKINVNDSLDTIYQRAKPYLTDDDIETIMFILKKRLNEE